MLQIDEYAYNACERNGTLESCELFKNRISAIESSHFLNHNEKYSWIYLGFEFCENMMKICDISQMEKKIEAAVKKGYKAAFVFPSVHQKSVPLVRKWLKRLAALNLISEWIVNDPGMFALLEEAGVSKNLVLGRMFEKAIRETRQNILEIPEVAENFEIFQPAESMKGICRILSKKYSICGAEIDTFPDGVMNLTDPSFECKGGCIHEEAVRAASECPVYYRVHYPDIFLSCSPYCEYANLHHEEKGRFLLHPLCGAECSLYEQKISAPNGKEFYKTGNVMLGKQTKTLEACVNGRCRIVYSNRIHLNANQKGTIQ